MGVRVTPPQPIEVIFLKRIIVLLTSLVTIVALMVFSVGADTVDVIDYNDYVTDITVDGDNDIVTVTIPSSLSGVFLFGADLSLITSGQSISYNYSAGEVLYLNFQMLSDKKFDLTNIPNGTVITYYYTISVGSTSSFSTTGVNVFTQYFNTDGEYISQQVTPVDEVWVNPRTSSVTISRATGSSCFSSYIAWDRLSSSSAGTLKASLSQVTLTFSISSLYRLQQETGKTNKLLEDLISGGSAGDDLMAGSDRLEDAGAGLGDDIGQIKDFEDQYMGQLEDNLDDIIASGADLSLLVAPLSFVHTYVNKIVQGVPSKYLLVFTLPMLFGIFLYIVGHPVRAPRPDISGDQVTRETFTETTVLTGPNAGRVSSTRTVSTSQEIGRVHRE